MGMKKTKDPNENDYLLVFKYAKNGDLHNYLSKNFKEITWPNKIWSLLHSKFILIIIKFIVFLNKHLVKIIKMYYIFNYK